MNACSDALPAVGSRCRLRRGVERFPHFVIDAGATGTVTEATESLIALRMDDLVAGGGMGQRGLLDLRRRRDGRSEDRCRLL